MAVNGAQNPAPAPVVAPAAAPVAAPAAADPLLTKKLTDMIAPKITTRSNSPDKIAMVKAMNDMRSALAQMSLLLGAMDVILVDLKISSLAGNADPLNDLSQDLNAIRVNMSNAAAYFGRVDSSLNKVDTSNFDAVQNQKFNQFKDLFGKLSSTFNTLAPPPQAPVILPHAPQNIVVPPLVLGNVPGQPPGPPLPQQAPVQQVPQAPLPLPQAPAQQVPQVPVPPPQAPLPLPQAPQNIVVPPLVFGNVPGQPPGPPLPQQVPVQQVPQVPVPPPQAPLPLPQAPQNIVVPPLVFGNVPGQPPGPPLPQQVPVQQVPQVPVPPQQPLPQGNGDVYSTESSSSSSSSSSNEVESDVTIASSLVDDEVESDVTIASSSVDDEVDGSMESDDATEEGLNP